MDKFVEKAKTWDQNPLLVEMAESFYQEILKNISINKNMDLLELGCGTGLVGLKFAPFVNSITMVDTSEAMLSVLKEKVDTNKIGSVKILKGDLKEAAVEKSSIDAVFSLMTFHHIEDIRGTLGAILKLLKPGGYVVIGDLSAEDGSFHGQETIAHNGFDLEEIKQIFSGESFGNINVYLYYIFRKPDSGGVIKSYNQFILIAQKTK